MTDGAVRSLSLFSIKLNSISPSVFILNLASNEVNNVEWRISDVIAVGSIMCCSSGCDIFRAVVLFLDICILSHSNHHVCSILGIDRVTRGAENGVSC